MQDLPNTRQSLIVRLKTSSDDAWSEFLQIYEEAIVRFCRSRGLQDADARDVTQEVFSALHDKIKYMEFGIGSWQLSGLDVPCRSKYRRRSDSCAIKNACFRG